MATLLSSSGKRPAYTETASLSLTALAACLGPISEGYCCGASPPPGPAPVCSVSVRFVGRLWAAIAVRTGASSVVGGGEPTSGSPSAGGCAAAALPPALLLPRGALSIFLFLHFTPYI